MSMDRWKRAQKAYLEIMSEPKAEGENGWTPPPGEMRDKKWSKMLRSVWNDYCAIRMQDSREFVVKERMKWCEDNAQYYWACGNYMVWYFSEKNTALLFKLTFGGEVEYQ